jgi:hypothetical protein
MLVVHSTTRLEEDPMQTTTLINIGLATCALACGAASSEPTAHDTSALQSAVPQKAWLTLDAAQHEGQPLQAQGASCQGGPPAMFAAMSASIMGNANGLLDGILDLVAHVTSGPPVAIAPGHAVWGPLASPNDPLVHRFDMQQVGPNAFHFQLSGKPMPAPDTAWIGLFQGTVVVPDPAHRAGDIAVDFGAMHALDPSTDPVAGGVSIHFENGPNARRIDESFSNVAGKNAPQPNDAQYHYAQDPNGLTFGFATRTDFDHDGVADELLNVQSRWLPPGAGKASVVVTGGSLGSKQVAAIECWAPNQATVFYADDIHATPPAGDPACCVP